MVATLFIVALYVLLLHTYTGAKPIKQLNSTWISAYTLNNTIPIEYFFVDDSNQGNGTHYTYNAASIQNMIIQSKKLFQKLQIMVGSYPKGEEHLYSAYLDKKWWFYYSILLHKDVFRDATVLIYGST